MCSNIWINQYIYIFISYFYSMIFFNILIIFWIAIETNYEMANYILDIQIDAKESNNINNNIMLNITSEDLKLAIQHYNENVINKMIKLYDYYFCTFKR